MYDVLSKLNTDPIRAQYGPLNIYLDLDLNIIYDLNHVS